MNYIFTILLVTLIELYSSMYVLGFKRNPLENIKIEKPYFFFTLKHKSKKKRNNQNARYGKTSSKSKQANLKYFNKRFVQIPK
jgi:hypothetical protein